MKLGQPLFSWWWKARVYMKPYHWDPISNGNQGSLGTIRSKWFQLKDFLFLPRSLGSWFIFGLKPPTTNQSENMQKDLYIHYTQIAVYRFMRSGGFLCGGPSDLFCGWVSDPPADDILVLVCCVNIDIYIITLALCVYMFTLHETIDFHICRYYGKRYWYCWMLGYYSQTFHTIQVCLIYDLLWYTPTWYRISGDSWMCPYNPGMSHIWSFVIYTYMI